MIPPYNVPQSTLHSSGLALPTVGVTPHVLV